MNEDLTQVRRRFLRRKLVLGVGATMIAVLAVVASLVFASDSSNSSLSTNKSLDTSAAGSAPEFALPGLAGQTIRLQQFTRKVVVVNFWASWCVPCREEVVVLKTLQKKWAAKGVQIVGIVENDAADSALAFQRRHRLTWPSAMDEDQSAAIAYGVRGVPETYVVGSDGRLVGKVLGQLRIQGLERLVRSALRASTSK